MQRVRRSLAARVPVARPLHQRSWRTYSHWLSYLVSVGAAEPITTAKISHSGPAPAIQRVAMDDIAKCLLPTYSHIDRPGVFAQVASALSAHSISIEAVIQKEQSSADASVSIVIMTDMVVESAVNAALKELCGTRQL